MKNIEIIERARGCSPFVLSGVVAGVRQMATPRTAGAWGTTVSTARFAYGATSGVTIHLMTTALTFAGAVGARKDSVDNPAGIRSWSPPV